MNISDTIIERPIGFRVGDDCFFIYPCTLGKTFLLERLFEKLEVNNQIISINPYMEALRICSEKKELVCRILSYHTFNKKEDFFDNLKVESRSEKFDSNLDNEELATLFIIILSGDNTETYIEYLGITKERIEQRRISELRGSKGCITFGGNSTYGTLIDCACQRYGWTMDYVVWGISFVNLKMLMADSITTIHLSEEEMKTLNIVDKKDIINADDPKNKDLVRKMIDE